MVPGLTLVEVLRRKEMSIPVIIGLADAVADVEDFDDLIADLKNVLFVYSTPKAPERIEAATVETPAVSMAELVSSAAKGGEA